MPWCYSTRASVSTVLTIYSLYWTSSIQKYPWARNILSENKNTFWKKLPSCLTHWGRVTHICVSKLTIIGSDNGLSPGRRQAIICTNAGVVLIRPIGTNFSEILIGNQTFPFKKMHLKMSSAKWRPLYLGLNVLRVKYRLNKHGWVRKFHFLMDGQSSFPFYEITSSPFIKFHFWVSLWKCN